MTLGGRIKKARESNGMTLLGLATKVGVSEATIQRYESGVIKNPKQPKLLALAKALNVDVNYLMNWNEEDAPRESSDYLDDDIDDIVRIYKMLGRKERHEMMAKVYELEKEVGKER